MPISTRFVIQSTVILLAVGFLTLVGIVATTIWLGERAQVYQRLANDLREVRIDAVELRSALQSAEASQRGFLVDGNEIYLAPFDNAKAQAQHYLAQLQDALRGEKEVQPLMQRLSAIIAEKVAEMDRSIRLKRNMQHDEAMAIFRTNRGKALMDEANVFLSSIIRNTDERLSVGLAEQQQNAAWLRGVTIGGGVLIVLVVAGVTATTLRYSHEIAQARDEVRTLNASLERRVRERTADLDRARSRAEMLLSEVNHRVANSLTMVAALVRLQSNAIKHDAAKSALNETETRIRAISEVHKRLYTSSETQLVALDEYIAGLLNQLEISMRAEGYGATLAPQLEPVKLATDASVNLGVVVTEWVVNAFKYAYPNGGGEIRVTLRQVDEGRGELAVEDSGVGRNGGVAKGTGLGSRLVTVMAKSMKADVQYVDLAPGTAARLVFPVASEQRVA
jgi:two-component sensor histidine kinase/CHASE3 domain sensor protein